MADASATTATIASSFVRTPGSCPAPLRLRAAGGKAILNSVAHTHDHAGARSRNALALALAITAAYTVAEVVGGVLTGSLALLADAVHMLSDNVALALALFAVWLASRPATPERTYGYKRAEVLAALANGVALVALAIWIFYEAVMRFRDPPDVLGGWMLVLGGRGDRRERRRRADPLAGAEGQSQCRGGLPTRLRRPPRLGRRRRGSRGHPRDRLARGRSTRERTHRRPRARELVVDPARLDDDPARGGSEWDGHARRRRPPGPRTGRRRGPRSPRLDDHVRLPRAIGARARRPRRGLPRADASSSRRSSRTSSGSSTRRSRSTMWASAARSSSSSASRERARPRRGHRLRGAGRGPRSRARAERFRLRSEPGCSARGRGTPHRLAG